MDDHSRQSLEQLMTGMAEKARLGAEALRLATPETRTKAILEAARAIRAREADILAASLTAALAFDDADAAQQYLNALSANPEAEAAGLYSSSGALLSGYRRDSSQTLPLKAVARPHPSVDGQLVVTAPVGSVVVRTFPDSS